MRLVQLVSPAEVRRSPLLGEHNQRNPYGTELGVTEKELAELKANGVI